MCATSEAAPPLFLHSGKQLVLPLESSREICQTGGVCRVRSGRVDVISAVEQPLCPGLRNWRDEGGDRRDPVRVSTCRCLPGTLTGGTTTSEAAAGTAGRRRRP